MRNIQKADPKTRRRAIWLVYLVLIAGLVLLVELGPDFDRFQTWLQDNPEFLIENISLIVLVMAVLILPVIAASIYLAWLGYLTVIHQRFPPKGLKVTRDTRILEGRSAIVRGYIVMALSMVIFFAAVSIPVLIWVILEDLAARIPN